MHKELERMEELIKDIINVKDVFLTEIFDYGEEKIEFMIIVNEFVVSVSIVYNLSYDFTAFDKTGEKIIYNNTKERIYKNELQDIFENDIDALLGISAN